MNSTLSVLLAVSLLAQSQGNARRQETAHVVVTAQPVSGAVAPGAKVALRVEIAPKAKMHVYSPEQKDYIPVSLTIEKSPSMQAQPAVFPKAEKYFFKALEETQLVYSKPFEIVQPVTLARGATPGTPVIVKGTLEYQACDESVCYRPQKVSVSWVLTPR